MSNRTAELPERDKKKERDNARVVKQVCQPKVLRDTAEEKFTLLPGLFTPLEGIRCLEKHAGPFRL